MASNFDFLKKVDKELFSIVEDGEKLFRDEYFNQSVVQFRIYAEKMAKNILNSTNPELTFDTILNNLKDKIKSEREKEFIDDLFFIKQQGNKCAHGEDISAIEALEVIRRAFEAGINYAWAKKKDENIDKLIFDETLLITQSPKKEEKMIDKYLKLAQQNENEEISKENFLNQKQGEFLSSVDKTVDENNIKNKNQIKNPSQYKKKNKKPLSEKQLEIKEKIKKAKKNLKENINITEKPKKQTKPKKSQKSKQQTSKKPKKSKKTKQDYSFLKALGFVIFVVFSILLLLKMMI